MRAARIHGLANCDGDAAEQLMRTCGVERSPAKTGSTLAALALEPVINSITETIECFWKDLPNKLACDVIDSGICLTGGGALIPGMREYLERRLKLVTKISPNPLASVAEGARVVLPVLVSLNHWH